MLLPALTKVVLRPVRRLLHLASKQGGEWSCADDRLGACLAVMAQHCASKLAVPQPPTVPNKAMQLPEQQGLHLAGQYAVLAEREALQLSVLSTLRVADGVRSRLSFYAGAASALGNQKPEIRIAAAAAVALISQHLAAYGYSQVRASYGVCI